jgi:hypothetical protein
MSLEILFNLFKWNIYHKGDSQKNPKELELLWIYNQWSVCLAFQSDKAWVPHLMVMGSKKKVCHPQAPISKENDLIHFQGQKF